MWPIPEVGADMVSFTEEIFNGKRFLQSTSRRKLE